MARKKLRKIVVGDVEYTWRISKYWELDTYEYQNTLTIWKPIPVLRLKERVYSEVIKNTIVTPQTVKDIILKLSQKSNVQDHHGK